MEVWLKYTVEIWESKQASQMDFIGRKIYKMDI